MMTRGRVTIPPKNDDVIYEPQSAKKNYTDISVILQLCVTLSGSPLVQVVARRSTHPSALFYVPECAHRGRQCCRSAHLPTSLSQPLLQDAELQEGDGGGIAKPRWLCCAGSAVLQMAEGRGRYFGVSTWKTLS